MLALRAPHPAPAGDLLPLHQAGPCCDVALQSGHRLLTPQRHGLHTGHVFPLLQVDSCEDREGIVGNDNEEHANDR